MTVAHTIIYGAAGSGKTTLVREIIKAHAGKNPYIFDIKGDGYLEFDHVYTSPSDISDTVASLAESLRLGELTDSVLVVDLVDVTRDKIDQEVSPNAGKKFWSDLELIARTGRHYGTYVIVTTNMITSSSVPAAVTELASLVIHTVNQGGEFSVETERA